MKIWLHECGGNLSNMTNQISISEPIDFALVIGDKSYRMQTDKEGNLMIHLINGVDVNFVAEGGYPTIKLVQSNKDSSDWYNHLNKYND